MQLRVCSIFKPTFNIAKFNETHLRFVTNPYNRVKEEPYSRLLKRNNSLKAKRYSRS